MTIKEVRYIIREKRPLCKVLLSQIIFFLPFKKNLLEKLLLQNTH